MGQSRYVILQRHYKILRSPVPIRALIKPGEVGFCLLTFELGCRPGLREGEDVSLSKLESVDARNSGFNNSARSINTNSPSEVLRQLFELLEKHAPVWYT